MIEHLRIARAAYFYGRKKAISDNTINKLFAELRQHAQKPSKNLFSAVRKKLGNARYSAISFSYERLPSFLQKEADVWERIYGFLLIVEQDGLISVMKTGLDLPSKFKTDHLEKIDGQHVELVIAQKAAVFEKLRLRNMSTSRLALRSKTLEANDLENAVPVSSASRFVPQAYTVKRPDGTNYSATPNTGRISNQSERAGIKDLVTWAGTVIGELGSGHGDTASFIKNFARSTSLNDIPSDVHPTSLAFDVSALSEAVFGENPQIRLVRKRGDAFVTVSKASAANAFEDLGQPFSVVQIADGHSIASPADGAAIGKVSINKTRIALPGFMRPTIADLYIEDVTGDAGADTKLKPLSRFLDQEDMFVVLFSDLSLAYINGALFRDQALLAGGALFLARLKPSALLAATTSEKGTFNVDQTEFAQGSVFRAVVDQVRPESNVLVCDDLGDEWADFISVNTESDPATVNFYHAKHGTRSLSASAFHESVGQAIKNLGRMTLPPEAMTAKYRGWAQQYRGQGVRSSIDRIVRGGNSAQVEAQIDAIRTAPDLLRRVYIVTSSLSRHDVELTFQNAAAGIAPSAHFVQLYWLLMSYFSACTEVGVFGYVICQP